MGLLRDAEGRQFEYLRLSVTDRCNFRCVYCLPQGHQARPDELPALSVPEIRNLVSGFAELGFWKVRLTGGEPTVRGDILDLARTVASVPGIRKVVLTTNGWRLQQLAAPLRAAGITGLNVSVDSLDPKRFLRTTGHARLNGVLKGIDAAFAAGFTSVKVNAVLMKGANEEDFAAFLEWTSQQPVTVRFIELMRTRDNGALFEQHHLPSGILYRRLTDAGWTPAPRSEGDGPAQEFSRPGHPGRIGLIAPYSSSFCRSCNRLRVSSQGGLRLCLFGEADFSLRPMLQSPHQREELMDAVQSLILRKPTAHQLQEGKYGSTASLAAIGG